MLGLISLGIFLQEPPIKLTNEEDHRILLDQLGIDQLRPGRAGMNPQAPNFANTDEAKATPFPRIPDLMALSGGGRAVTAKDWSRRREEIRQAMDTEIYGVTPRDLPSVAWSVESQEEIQVGPHKALLRQVRGRVDNSAYPMIEVTIQLAVVTPLAASEKVPLILEFGFPGFAQPRPRPGAEAKSWQEQVLDEGWGYAILNPASVQADSGAGLTRGIIGLVNRGRPRRPEQWGALKAWAWGASRCLDFFESDQKVDTSKVAIEGLSRYGKAAAVAMAYEPRMAMAFIGSSGQGGIKIWRRDFGETVENVASSGEYHWMGGNYVKYAGPLNPGDMPVDAHMLLALCAPRPTFVGVGSLAVEGIWIDPAGTFQAASLASPAWELLGEKGVGDARMPAEDEGLTSGSLAFRQHSGGHTNGPNWPAFIAWAKRWFGR